jgi:hypothetical protein
MTHNPADPALELRQIVDRKVAALIREMEDADWGAMEVALTIRQVVESQWLSRAEALGNARDAVSQDFVSDGNEG